MILSVQVMTTSVYVNKAMYVIKSWKGSLCVYTYMGGDMHALLPAKFIKLFEPVEIVLFYWRKSKRTPQ